MKLYVEPVWLIECWRCAHSEEWGADENDAGPKAEAVARFEARGWTTTRDDYQLCPQCSGLRRTA